MYSCNSNCWWLGLLEVVELLLLSDRQELRFVIGDEGNEDVAGVWWEWCLNINASEQRKNVFVESFMAIHVTMVKTFRSTGYCMWQNLKTKASGRIKYR